jgi:hypothetical protein
MLIDLSLLDGEAGAAGREQHRPRAGRALVDDEEALLGHSTSVRAMIAGRQRRFQLLLE